MPAPPSPRRRRWPRQLPLLLLLAAAAAGLVPARGAPVPAPRGEAEYNETRDGHLEAEAARRFDADTAAGLTEAEREAGRRLDALRAADYREWELDWPPALSFAEAKPLMERSPLFEVLQRLPKGGMLHAHAMTLADTAFFVQNATYRDECYMLLDGGERNGSMRMFGRPPAAGAPWRRVNDLRAAAPSPEEFDARLRTRFMLGEGYLNGVLAWETFIDLFARLGYLYTYRPVYEAWWHRLCQNMLADGVQYLELRQTFHGLYEFDAGGGYRHLSAQQQLDLQRGVVDQYRRRHPDRFFGVASIWSESRTQAAPRVYEEMEAVLAFMRAGDNRRAVLGFDLVGEEHGSHSALDFVPDVLRLRREHGLSGDGGPDDLPFFFHAGESDWWSNRNVLDAVMMGTRRIGHGYALGKRPYVRRMVREAGVAVEVCPVSNRELLLLEDLRNHPAAQLVYDGVPFVLASDDPALYGYESVTHDWYLAFVSWDLGISGLKQLALNSVRHSGLLPVDRARLEEVWRARWDAFVASLQPEPREL